MDLPKIYDSADSVAPRSSTAAASATTTGKAGSADGPKLTQAERLAKMYDGPDTTVGGRREPIPERGTVAETEKLARLYDDPTSRAAAKRMWMPRRRPAPRGSPPRATCSCRRLRCQRPARRGVPQARR
jgi:hypothetical protein